MSFLNKNQTKELYYNINVVNKQSDPVALNYSDIRNNNLLDNVDNYELSILRFQVDLSEVPLMLFPTTEYETFQNASYDTVDNSFYSITLEKNGPTVFDQQFVNYISYGRKTPEIYNFEDFCDMLNVAIKASFSALALVGGDVPIFLYDKSSSSIKLALPLNFLSHTATDYGFYINKNLYDDFGRDFPGTITNLSNGRYYKINNNWKDNQYKVAVDYRVNGALITPAWGFTGGIVETYYPNLGNLVACKSIVFTTSQIPVLSEYISDNLDLSNDTSFSFSKIMKDFELSLEGADAILSRGVQNFVISSQFQMSQLKSGGESLNNIDLQAFWRDAHGRLHPLLLPSGSSFSMKLLFRRSN